MPPRVQHCQPFNYCALLCFLACLAPTPRSLTRPPSRHCWIALLLRATLPNKRRLSSCRNARPADARRGRGTMPAARLAPPGSLHYLLSTYYVVVNWQVCSCVQYAMDHISNHMLIASNSSRGIVSILELHLQPIYMQDDVSSFSRISYSNNIFCIHEILSICIHDTLHSTPQQLTRLPGADFLSMFLQISVLAGGPPVACPNAILTRTRLAHL